MMSNFRRSYLYVIILLIPLMAKPLRAQALDNAGTEFYLSFGANEGTGESENSFQVYVTSRVATSCHVEVPSLKYSKNFTVTPGAITVVDLPNNSYGSTVEIGENENEKIIKGRSVHITSINEVTVYGINHKTYSSDAFMGIPVDALGKEYLSICFPTSSASPSDPIGGFNSGTASEFWITAVEDSTVVTITPSAKTLGNHAATKGFSLTLQAGDSYLVEGDPTTYNNDLTSSHIVATKPIAVFSGHIRASVPQFYLDDQLASSRDHLVEQVPPVTAWGDSALVVPFASSKTIEPDVVRIISGADSNIITIGSNKLQKVFKKGEFYDIAALTSATAIHATKPIMVGQYMHTSIRMYGNGDPALALCFPVEQYDTSYTFIAIQNSAFTDNFINVVADSVGVTTTTLDGRSISRGAFHPIANSNYYYAQLDLDNSSNTPNVGPGAHTIRSATPIGLTVYGLGSVDSYAYTGGSRLSDLTLPAAIQDTEYCGKRTMEQLLDLKLPIAISDPYPNPAYGYSQAVSIGYIANDDITISWKMSDSKGTSVLQAQTLSVEKGQGIISIPLSSFPSSGVYYVTITATNPATAAERVVTTSITVKK